MYQLLIHEAARLEMEEAAIWFEQQKQGLGIQFIEEVEKELVLIQNSPKLFARRKKNYRECLVKPFPFLIVYRIDQVKESIVVLSVFHTSKNPKQKYR